MAKRKIAKAPKAESLLVELLTEELPPKSLRKLSLAFADALADYLRDESFIGSSDEPEEFATPRRLAVLVPNVRAKQPDSVYEKKGPSVQAGLDAEGKPTKALIGFARSCGASPEHLERRKDEKSEYFVYRVQRKGEPLAARLAGFVEDAIKRLPVARLMRWGSGETQFVRPVHGVILLHGAKVVSGTVLGVKSGNKTLGHRFLSKGTITVTHADKYAGILYKSGKVVASFEERREAIDKRLRKAAAALKGHVFLPDEWSGSSENGSEAEAEEVVRQLEAQPILRSNEELLDEVTAIVEWPVVYTGEFEQEFLNLPAQCISLTMQKNQKYFALISERAELLPKYLLVSNLETRNPANIVHGNARVLRARLADAKFFYEQDLKTTLTERVQHLANVIYHNRLGTQLERVQRLQKLACTIGQRLGEDERLIDRAAYLCKADLLTEMVNEFPELQGVMGAHYARKGHEQESVAKAIYWHYAPRFAGEELPNLGNIVWCLAIADKLDSLVGIYGIGLVPTGDKDPFGLRRAAIGMVRILIEKALPLDVMELLQLARSYFPNGVVTESVTPDLYGFLLDRLRSYLRDRHFKPDEIEAVLALNPTRLDQVVPRLEAIRQFRAAPEGQALAAASKRIQNILRQAGGGDPDKIEPAIDGTFFQEAAEKELARQLGAVAGRVHPLTAAGDYAGALKELSDLRGAVDAFFDKVMVMVDDENLRKARLQLLAEIRREFREIADVSRLQG